MKFMDMTFIGNYSFDCTLFFVKHKGTSDNNEMLFKIEHTNNSDFDNLTVKSAVTGLGYHGLIPFTFDSFLTTEQHKSDEVELRRKLNKSFYIVRSSSIKTYFINNSRETVSVIDHNNVSSQVSKLVDVVPHASRTYLDMQLESGVYVFFSKHFVVKFNDFDYLSEEKNYVSEVIMDIQDKLNNDKQKLNRNIKYQIFRQYRNFLDKYGDEYVFDHLTPNAFESLTPFVIHIGVVGFVPQVHLDKYKDIYYSNTMLVVSNSSQVNKYASPVDNPTADYVITGKTFETHDENVPVRLYDSKGVFGRVYCIYFDKVIEVKSEPLSDKSDTIEDGLYIHYPGNDDDRHVKHVTIEELIDDINNNHSGRYLTFTNRHDAEKYRDVLKREETMKQKIVLDTKLTEKEKLEKDYEEKRKTEALLFEIKQKAEKEAAEYRRKLEEFKIENERIKNEQEKMKKEYELKKVKTSETIEYLKLAGITATTLVTLYMAWNKFNEN